MPQYAIGIDIGSHSVKAVVAERGFRSVEIKRFHEIPVHGDDAEARSRALAQLIDDVRAPGALYAVAVPGERVALRVLSLPFGDPKAIESVLPAEVEAALPFDLDDIVWDSQVVERTAEGSRVLVVAARTEDLAAQLAELTENRIDPRVLDAEPVGLGALSVAEPSLATGPIAIVDAGHRRTGVVALEDGRVVFARTVAKGAADLEKALRDSAGLDEHRAARALESGIVPGTGDHADAVLYRAARMIAQEVQRSLASHVRGGGAAPERIILAGGLALVPGFERVLEEVCRIPVAPFALTNEEVGASALSPVDAPRAATAIALMMRASGEGRAVSINLRRGPFAYHKDTEEVSGFVFKVAAAIAIVLALASVDYVVKVWMLKSERAYLDAKIVAKVKQAVPDIPSARLQDADAALSILQTEVGNLDNQVKTLSGGSLSGLEILRRVSEKMPADVTVDVSKFDFQNGLLRIEGTTDSFESIDKIQKSLADVEGFAEVEVKKRGTEPGTDKKTFNISAKATG